MAPQSSSSRCKYCHKELRSDSAMKRHIAATPLCKHKWEKEIMGLSTERVTGKSRGTHLEIDEGSDFQAFIPDPSPEPTPSKRVHVEEVEDEDSVQVRQAPDIENRRFVEQYPSHRRVGIVIGQGKTKFQLMYENQREHGQSTYAPFTNKDEWELARWLSRRVGQKAIDEYLKLSFASLGGFFLFHYLLKN